MAQGKSEELKNIGRKPAMQVCVCGADYNSHLDENGELPTVLHDDHRPISGSPVGVSRAQRRAYGMRKQVDRNAFLKHWK